jgi:hypothetical protein
LRACAYRERQLSAIKPMPAIRRLCASRYLLLSAVGRLHGRYVSRLLQSISLLGHDITDLAPSAHDVAQPERNNRANGDEADETLNCKSFDHFAGSDLPKKSCKFSIIPPPPWPMISGILPSHFSIHCC